MKKLLLSIAILSAALSSCAEREYKYIEKSHLLMGTVVQIKAAVCKGDDEAKTRAAINKAFDEMRRIEGVFSVYKKDSEVSKINRLRRNERLLISREVMDLIEMAVEFSEKTEGVFDITVKPLVDLWNKAKISKKLPSDGEVKHALERTGYKFISLDRTRYTISFKKDGMGLDFGGMAKGYATDRAIRILKENGVKDALVNSGGDMYCLGRKTSKDLWNVGIRHPRDKDKVFLEIGLEDRAVDTSGDYEKFFTRGGRRYSHIIDMRTGYPVVNDVVSATIIAPYCTIADMLATTSLILGEDSFEMIKDIDGVDAVIVFKDDKGFRVKTTDLARNRYAISKEKF